MSKIREYAVKYGLTEAQMRETMKLHLGLLGRDMPTKLYVPNIGQWRLFKILEREHKPFSLNFLAGNGVGKTNSMINLLAGLLWGREVLNSAWLGSLKFWDEIEEKFAGRIRIRVVCKADDLRPGGSVYEEVLQWFPKGRYETKNGGKNHWAQLIADNGITVNFKTFDQDVVSHAGSNEDIILVNEPMPGNIYGETVGRLRNSAMPMLITFCTPLAVSAWFYDQVVEGEDDYDTVLVMASIWDNCKDRPGTNGILAETTINQLIEQWRREDPEQAEARITGQFQHLSGRVYKAFTNHVHIIDPFIIDKSFEGYLICDPHDRRAPAMQLWVVNSMGECFCAAEYPTVKYTDMGDSIHALEHHAAQARKMVERTLPLGMAQVVAQIIDPNKGPTKTMHMKKSIMDEFNTHGFSFNAKANDDLDYGHKKVAELLFFDNTRALDERNAPKMFIFRGLVNSIAGLQKYAYLSAAKQTGSSMTSKLDPTYKDFADCARYFAVSLKRFVGRVKGGNTMSRIKNARNKAYGR